MQENKTNIKKEYIIPIIVGLVTAGLISLFAFIIPDVKIILQTNIPLWVLLLFILFFLFILYVLLKNRQSIRKESENEEKIRIRLSMKNPDNILRLNLFKIGDTVKENRSKNNSDIFWLKILEISKKGIITKNKSGKIEMFAPDELYTNEELNRAIEEERERAQLY